MSYFILKQVRTRENPTKWPIYDPKAEMADSMFLPPPPPLPRTFRDTNAVSDNLNPDVAEFVPGQDSSPPSTYTNVMSSDTQTRYTIHISLVDTKEESKKKEIIDDKKLEKDKPEKHEIEGDNIWREVRRRGKNAPTKNKESREKEIRVEREELDFQFDEELDVPMGRNNQFSNEWYVYIPSNY